jgi:hypothetical protein
VLRQQARDLTDRPAAADETGQRRRQPVHHRRPALRTRTTPAPGSVPPPGQQGWRLQPGRGQLEQPHRPVQVLQPVLAHVHQGEPRLPLLLLLILDDRLRRLGHQHLRAAGGSTDPGRAVHGQAGISSPGPDRVTGVNADPDPDRRTIWPLMSRQRPLDLQRAQHGLLRTSERREERISLGIHLRATLPGDGRADQPPVLGQDLRVPLTQCLDQARRPLDVGEHEGDRPARKPAHPAVPQPIPGRSRQQRDPMAAASTPAAATTSAPGTPDTTAGPRRAAGIADRPLHRATIEPSRSTPPPAVDITAARQAGIAGDILAFLGLFADLGYLGLDKEVVTGRRRPRGG